ncbi:hypothetical protein CRG98_032113 [Punica granatum]|uniref:Uncharacterized protein n=1 Tax=Punica granatum TaxID=22663 RepID=A0A2I0IUS0_PUNGR|nr:hypothetical protein CRG98_032113 [Punica granatum]
MERRRLPEPHRRSPLPLRGRTFIDVQKGELTTRVQDQEAMHPKDPLEAALASTGEPEDEEVIKVINILDATPYIRPVPRFEPLERSVS